MRQAQSEIYRTLWDCEQGGGNFLSKLSILNYFLIEVFSFPLSLVCSFRGRNVLKEGGFVTPHPDKVYGTCNHRVAYVHQGLP